MKLSFYIHRTDASPENVYIYNSLNKLIDDGKVEDANVFFNDVSYNPVTPKFGIFDAANIWNYTGVLVCTTVQNLVKATKAVNKMKPVFLYDRNQKAHPYSLMGITQPVVVFNEEDSKEFYRLTGLEALLIEDFEQFRSF